jgi:2-amino-4-hydroxy-6-hydroxymethyldihydropteridine diphosphokinase
MVRKSKLSGDETTDERRTVVLGLGSNLGNRLNALVRATRQLEKRVLDGMITSSVYETEPVGGPEQPDYLNIVLVGSTGHAPRVLLQIVQDIEHNLGRIRNIPWGPRTIDIDIILLANEVIREPDLIIPHPELQNRRFVLVPLQETAPQITIPPENESPGQILNRCPDRNRISPVLSPKQFIQMVRKVDD